VYKKNAIGGLVISVPPNGLRKQERKTEATFFFASIALIHKTRNALQRLACKASGFFYFHLPVRQSQPPNGLRYLRWGGDGEAVQLEKC
jgi:hypothetical protein